MNNNANGMVASSSNNSVDNESHSFIVLKNASSSRILPSQNISLLDKLVSQNDCLHNKTLSSRESFLSFKKKTFTRIAIIQAIYCYLFHVNVDVVVNQFMSGEILQKSANKVYADIDIEMFRAIMLDIDRNYKKYSDMLSRYLDSTWVLDRLDYVEQAILLCGVSELSIFDTPAIVVINEYVNAANSFCVNASFINGIFHNITQNINSQETEYS